jgi:recombination protein RecA
MNTPNVSSPKKKENKSMARATQERTPTKKDLSPSKQANPEREAALNAAIEQIHKRCGDGSIMRLGDRKIIPAKTISTGSLSLDNALGIGGIPRGRVVEIFGPESSGKTTLALHVIANAQKNHGVAAFIDAEHALDPLYAQRLGVNLNSLLVSQPDYGEQALEIAHTLISSSAVDVVVIDSVAALVPKAELDGEMGDHHIGLQARLMSQAMRKLSAVINRSNTSAIFINQIREKIGVMFGSPQTTPGGRALKFYSSVRIDIRRIGQIKDGTDIIGNRTLAKVVKNKCAPPFRNAEFDIIYNKGISWIGDVLDHAVAAKIVNKSGAWYSYQKTRLGQGRENAVRTLETEPTILLEIETAVLAKLAESH